MRAVALVCHQHGSLRNFLSLGLLLAAVSGCTVGPDYRRPPAPTADAWLDASDRQIVTEARIAPEWWRSLEDAVLDRLIETAYRQNFTLQAAGLRILEAQARRGIAIGGLFPQTQAVSGLYSARRLSLNALSKDVRDTVDRDNQTLSIGFDAAWEIDLWGRLRRAVEAADAELLASVASYDDVLVSLIAEVATTYVQSRALEERLLLATDNVRVQREGLRIARARFEEGGTSDLDVQQATTLLADTEASIPDLQAQLRQSHDRLSVLIGVPPGEIEAPLASTRGGIPAAPPRVMVDIPSALLRRRPDIRRAERQMAAQSARIGSSFALLFPRFELNGSIGLSAEDAAHLFAGDSLQAIGGPRFDWPVLNYGRLINAVRAQDAAFQQAVMIYANTVLQAQREVEDALVAFLRGSERVHHLERAVAAANRAVEIALIQYREGAADYTRVLTAQQSKLREDDALTSARAAVTLSVIALYRALGGGWEVRLGKDFVSDEVKQQMADRTWWGRMSDSERRQRTVDQVQAEADEERSWWEPRWWWPQW